MPCAASSGGFPRCLRGGLRSRSPQMPYAGQVLPAASLPRSASRCSHFGIRALPWASQSDDKAALRRDRPIKTMRSRGLPSLPENRTVFSSTCRNSVRLCAVGLNRSPFRGSWSPHWQSPTAQYRSATFLHPL